MGILRQDHLTEAIRSMLSTSGVPNFTLISLEPQLKEGGIFVRYRYQDFNDEGTAPNAVEEQLRTSLADQGGIPSWANLDRSDVWAVKGIPWREVRMFESGTRRCPDPNTFRTCNVFRPPFSRSPSKVQMSQKNNFGTFSECVIARIAGGDPGVHYSHAAVRSDPRIIATHEWASRYPQVRTSLFPEYPVGDNRQKCHAQLLFRHERDYHKAKNWIRASHTGSRSEGLVRKSPKDHAPGCGLPVRKPDLCGKNRIIVITVHGY